MKRVALFLLALVSCGREDMANTSKCGEQGFGSPRVEPAHPKWQVFFSPDGGCEAHVVELIRGAKTSIRVQAYSFTSHNVSQALVEQAKAGVDVQVLLDKSNLSGQSELQTLREGHVSVRIDAKHAIAHSKVIVVDHEKTEMGSFNYSSGAEHKNAENCLFVEDTVLAKLYEDNWAKHEAHSRSLAEPL